MQSVCLLCQIEDSAEKQVEESQYHRIAIGRKSRQKQAIPTRDSEEGTRDSMWPPRILSIADCYLQRERTDNNNITDSLVKSGEVLRSPAWRQASFAPSG